MKIIKMILWPFLIRGKLKRMIKITTKERECFKEVLKWGEENTATDIKYLESRIEIKNEVLYQLRNLL
jgi:hypothetical protein